MMKAHQFHIGFRKKEVNIDNKIFHLVLWSIFLHLNIYLLDNFHLFWFHLFYFILLYVTLCILLIKKKKRTYHIDILLMN